MILLIGFTGKAEAGKTTMARLLYDNLEKSTCAYIFPFASVLKEMLLKAKICTEEEMYLKKTEYSRKMMQKIGTDLIREQIDSTFFIKKMEEKLRKIKEEEAIIIFDDVRFVNEAEWIKNNKGIIIKIIRPSVKSEDTHISENLIDKIEADYEIWNCKTIKNLKELSLIIAKDVCDLMKGKTHNG